MTLWFFQDDQRVSIERLAVSALAERAPWLKGSSWTLIGSNLALLADIQVGEAMFSVVLEYPAMFPAASPTVSPKVSGERWSGHQYLGSGELCLEWGPDNWEPNITGADLLESAYKLLSTEKNEGNDQRRIVDSRHKLTLGQELRGSILRVAITPECESYLASLQEATTGAVKFWFVNRDGDATLHIQRITPDNLESWEAPLIPETVFLARGFEHMGRFAITNLASQSFNGKSKDELIGALEGNGCVQAVPQSDEDEMLCILLVRNNSGDIGALLLPDSGDGKVTQVQIFCANTDSDGRSGPTGFGIENKRVGLVGLGSAGSKIALTLGRSGVTDFLLVDDDIFLPENIVRHTLDYRNVGEHKVKGVKEQLEALRADMNIDIAELRLSGQEASSSVSHRLEQLCECDVVIDATANSRTFIQLAEAVRQAGTPLVWLEVFGGGIGGFVARYRPGKDPDPFTGRGRLYAYLEGKVQSPGAAEEPYSGETEDGEPLIATDAEVGIIALHAARLAADILEEREPSIFPHSLYLIGLERGWIFDAPFHTIGLDLGGPSDAPERKDKPLSQENKEFLEEIINRAASRSSD